MATHSCVISPRFKGALAHVAEGKYGRMFDGKGRRRSGTTFSKKPKSVNTASDWARSEAESLQRC
jgi:hypothetical protein